MKKKVIRTFRELAGNYKLYQKILIAITLVAVIGAGVFGVKFLAGDRKNEHEAFLLASEMDICLLQCRRAEKNFLLRHEQYSSDDFTSMVLELKRQGLRISSITGNQDILRILEDINVEISIYENAFQDMKGLYDSKSFGPVSEPALIEIIDEVTLMEEPADTPSSVETTASLIEAARNLEYFVQFLPNSFAALAATLNLRRWEKNIQKIYNELENGAEAGVTYYKGKLYDELSKLGELIKAGNTGAQKKAPVDLLKIALRRYELNFDKFTANKDAFHVTKNKVIISARKIEDNILIMKNILTPESSQMDTVVLRMDISLLQCRRAEKNFLLLYDTANVDSFTRGIRDLRELGGSMKALTKDKVTVSLLDDIEAEISIYENAFQDIKGLYDSKSFGSVSDQSLMKIADGVTLMSEPAGTPSAVETTRSLIEAGRNLEYYVRILSKDQIPVISVLQARRWEKNFQNRYDSLTGDPDSRSSLYIKRIEQEIINIRNWLSSVKKEGGFLDEPGLLKSSLDRYEYNLGQLSRNFDAFYVKRKEMIKSARNMEWAVQMIKDKVFNTASESEIDGIYYLSPKLPIHGQAEGNYHDVGSLLASRPSNKGYRHCKNWIQFYFDQDGHYFQEKVISSLYFHIWIRTVDDSIDIGYEKKGRYSGGSGAMDNYITVNYDASKGYTTRNGCSLITGKIDMDDPIRVNDIYKFTFKLSGHSGYPSVVMAPNQYSFIIINPPSDRILKSEDSDKDGLNTYEELFVYYTNPYDEDTDGDGLTDGVEVLKETSPNINDLYSGGVIDGVNDTPHITNHKTFDGDWIVDKNDRFLNTGFTLHGNLIIRSGATLALDNCILYMNRETNNNRIYIEKGGALNLRKTEIDLNETGYWYKAVEGSDVDIESNFDVYGTVNLQESIIKNSLGIAFFQESKTSIRNSSILNCYHLSFEGVSDAVIEGSVISNFIGIPIYCTSSSLVIRNTILNVEYSGVGMYCFASSPIVVDSRIIVCEDEDSEDWAFILVENSHPVLSNTYFNTKRVKHDKSSEIMFK